MCSQKIAGIRDEGLGALPGGAPQIFDDRVHDEVFKGKVRADRWFDVHRTAHSLGIYSNATMLYGHVETPAERVGHLIKLRELQREATERRSDGATKGEKSEATAFPSVASSLRRS